MLDISAKIVQCHDVMQSLIGTRVVTKPESPFFHFTLEKKNEKKKKKVRVPLDWAISLLAESKPFG